MHDNPTWPVGQNTWHPPPWLKYSRDFQLKYWQSFFWGAGMCLGMVPRDIEPVTSLEAIVTTFTMFVGLLLTVFVISSFTSAFASIDQKNALAGKQLDAIRNFLLLKAVPTDLRSRILEYYQYIFTSSQSMVDLQLLHDMPPNLSTQLAISVNAKLISKCAFFYEVSNASLAALVSTMTPHVFVPGQLLCTEGQPLRSIYFINRGKVQLLQHAGSDTELVLRVLSENDNLGLDDFSESSEPFVALSARSLTYSDVMSLSVEELGAAMDHDAQERVRREEERVQREKEKHKAGGKESVKDGANGLAKPDLTACLRKAGNIARLRSRMTGAPPAKSPSREGGQAGSGGREGAGGSGGGAGGGGSAGGGVGGDELGATEPIADSSAGVDASDESAAAIMPVEEMASLPPSPAKPTTSAHSADEDMDSFKD